MSAPLGGNDGVDNPTIVNTNSTQRRTSHRAATSPESFMD
jgi:hypothetical protein